MLAVLHPSFPETLHTHSWDPDRDALMFVFEPDHQVYN